MGRFPQILLIAIASALFGMGLGPLLVSGVTDLLGLAAASISIANIVVPLTTVVALVLGAMACRERKPGMLQWLRHPRLRWIFAAMLAVAWLSVLAADIDRSNTTSWRNARHMVAGEGISKRPQKEFGRQFARLTVGQATANASLLGSIPLEWRTWFVGGRVEVLVRMRGVDADTTAELCGRRQTIEVAATNAGDVLSRSGVTRDGQCGNWQLVQLNVPRGAEQLRIVFAEGGSVAGASADIMVAVNELKYGWLWALSSVVGIAITLTIVVLFGINLREIDKPAARQPPIVAQSISAGKKRGYYTLGAVVVFLIASNAFVHWYVSQERTIYTWDYSGYWMSSRNVSDFLQGAERKSVSPEFGVSNPGGAETTDGTSNEPNTTMPDPGAIGALIRSLRFAEYNVSSNLPVAVAMAVFGGSRMVYEQSLLNIYALATVLMLVLLVRGCARNETAAWPDWWPLIPVIAVLCMVPFWIPILRGYMGVSVAAFNLAAFWLYLRQPVREIGTLSLVAIGALLLAGVMLQRWSAYWVVGFLVMAFVDSMWTLLGRRKFDSVALLQSLRAPLVIGFSAFYLFAVVAWPKIVRTVTTDYADLYSAFQEDDSLLSALERQINAFGAGIWALIAAALVVLIVAPRTRRVALLVALQTICSFLLFVNTQTMGPHQYFIILPGLLLLLSLGLLQAIADRRRLLAMSGVAGTVLLLGFGLASAQLVFVAEDGAPENRSTTRLLSQSYRPPLVSNDLESFIDLAQFIDELMLDAPPGQGIYILSGSATLNANHLSTMAASTGVAFDSVGRILGSSVVDKRDGFPREMFSAHLVISSDPVQLSRRPSDQRVISIPADFLFAGNGIGAAYELLPRKFRLDGGVDAVVFRRTRANTADEIDLLSEALRKFYPDRPEVYE